MPIFMVTQAFQYLLFARESILHWIALLAMCVWVWFWTLFRPIYLSVYFYTNTTQAWSLLQLYNKSGGVSCSSILFFFSVILVIFGPLHFHLNFGIGLSFSTKKFSWSFDSDCVESIGHLGNNIDFFFLSRNTVYLSICSFCTFS